MTVDGNKVGAKCVFPFKYHGTMYKECTMINDNQPWCSTKTDSQYNHVSGQGEWGHCSSECLSDDEGKPWEHKKTIPNRYPLSPCSFFAAFVSFFS